MGCCKDRRHRFEVRTAPASLRETQTDGGLVVGLRQAEKLHAFGLHKVALRSRAEARSQGGPKTRAGADESSEKALFALARRRV